MTKIHRRLCCESRYVQSRQQSERSLRQLVRDRSRGTNVTGVGAIVRQHVLAESQPLSKSQPPS